MVILLAPAARAIKLSPILRFEDLEGRLAAFLTVFFFVALFATRLRDFFLAFFFVAFFLAVFFFAFFFIINSIIQLYNTHSHHVNKYCLYT